MHSRIRLSNDFKLILFLAILLAIVLSQSCSAVTVNEPSQYVMTDVTFSLVVENTSNLNSLENAIRSRLESSGAQSVEVFDSSASTSELLSNDVVLETKAVLGSTKVADIQSSGGKLILVHAGVGDEGSVSTLHQLNPGNYSMQVTNNSRAAFGYPVDALVNLSGGDIYELTDTGTYGTEVTNVNTSRALVASKIVGVGKTALIGFNMSSHHEWRLLEKAVYWMMNKQPIVPQNSRYCLYNCPWNVDLGGAPCTPCTDAVILVTDPTSVTGQEDAVYNFTYTQFGDLMHKIELSEITIANLTPTRLVVSTQASKITSMIPGWRNLNKSLMLTHEAARDTESNHFNGTITTANTTQQNNGDTTITNNQPNQITQGYPINTRIQTQQNNTPRYLSNIPNYTTLANTTNGSLLSYYRSSYSTVVYGFDPYIASQGYCNESGYQSMVLMLRSVSWLLGSFNVSRTASDTVVMVYNNDLYNRCGSSTLNSQESSVYSRLLSKYGAGNVTLVDLSIANATDYTNTTVIVSIASNRVSSVIPGWRNLNKSLMLTHEAARDTESNHFNGTITTANTTQQNNGDTTITNNQPNQITQGYPINTRIQTQQNNTPRYLSNIPNYTTLANTTNGSLLSYSDTSSRVVVYGFSPASADLDECTGYHGWKLFDRSMDWLHHNLNITTTQASRIVFQYYGYSNNTVCTSNSMVAAYNRTLNRPYGGSGNITVVDLSMANATDYTDTEVIVIGSGYRVSSLIYGWRSATKDLLFMHQGVEDAVNHYGGSWSTDKYSSGYVNITSSSSGEPTYGYPVGARIHTDLVDRRVTHTITGFTKLASNVEGDGLLSIKGTAYSNALAFGLNLTYTDQCTGYHGWKLFDRSMDWLLGVLSVPQEEVGTVGLVVDMYPNESETCLGDEETATRARLQRLDNISYHGGVNVTLLEVSMINAADYSDTKALVVTDSNLNSLGSYDETLLNSVGLLLFKDGMDKFKRKYGSSCESTLHNGSLVGRVLTSNDDNRFENYPPYGYPYNARINVYDGSERLCYWSSLPTGYFGFVGRDTNEWQKFAVASQAGANYPSKLVLLGYRPYEAWSRGLGDYDNGNYHGSTVFDRSMLWLIDDIPQKTEKSKDITLVVYNLNNMSTGEQAVWSQVNSTFGSSSFSTVDLSNVISTDSCGTSRFTALGSDLVEGIAQHWVTDLDRGLVLLGESIYDGVSALQAASSIDPLDDEYSIALEAEVVNNSYSSVINSHSIGDKITVTSNATESYALQNTNVTGGFTPVVKHANQILGGGGDTDEILLALSENPSKVVLFGVNPASWTSSGVNWTMNSVIWVKSMDASPPTVNSIQLNPSTYSNNTPVVFTVNVSDNRNWSVYRVVVNYTIDYVNWSTVELDRTYDPDPYSCVFNSAMDLWNGTVGGFTTGHMVYRVRAWDSAGNSVESSVTYYGVEDTNGPVVSNVSFSPYMPSNTDDVYISWNTNEFANATLYYRLHNTSSWTTLNQTTYTLWHLIDTRNHSNGTYEYWMNVCDYSGNCRNESNNQEYYMFCVGPGCDQNPPNITSVSPSNNSLVSPGTMELTVNLTTNEWARCNYDTRSGMTFNSMNYTFTSTESTNHSTQLSIYSNTTNNYYIKCRDMYGNNNTVDYYIQYRIDTEPPTIALNSPVDGGNVSGGMVSFTYTPSDDSGIANCSLIIDNITRATNTSVNNSMQNTFTFSGLCDGYYRWTILCWDNADNSAYANNTYIFNVNTSMPRLSFGSEGTGSGFMMYPQGITVWEDKIYVADTDNSRYQVFNKTTGSYISSAGSYSCPTGEVGEPGKFCYPEAIDVWSSVNDSLRIYVADTTNNRVQIFSQSNTLAGNLTGLDDPSGLAADSSNIYVSDTDHQQIRVYNRSTNALSRQISPAGMGSPQGLDVDSEGNIYVVDSSADKVFITNQYGTLLTSIGSSGSGNGEFNSPGDVAIGPDGNIYVIDTVNNRIQVFNSTYSHIRTFGGVQGSDPTDFYQPAGIDVDSSGLVYVADTKNSRVQVYSFMCNVTATSTTTTSTTTTTISTTTTTTTSTTTTVTCPSNQQTDADTNHDCQISNHELLVYIDAWSTGAGVTNTQLLKAISVWSMSD